MLSDLGVRGEKHSWSFGRRRAKKPELGWQLTHEITVECQDFHGITKEEDIWRELVRQFQILDGRFDTIKRKAYGGK